MWLLLFKIYRTIFWFKSSEFDGHSVLDIKFVQNDWFTRTSDHKEVWHFCWGLGIDSLPNFSVGLFCNNSTLLFISWIILLILLLLLLRLVWKLEKHHQTSPFERTFVFFFQAQRKHATTLKAKARLKGRLQKAKA